MIFCPTAVRVPENAAEKKLRAGFSNILFSLFLKLDAGK